MQDASQAAARPDPGPSVAGRNNKWFAVGALLVAAVAFGIITYGGIGSNLVYYWGPSELEAAGDKAIGATIRLGGMVSEGSIERGAGASSLQFNVTDGKAAVRVVASGVPPQMFREGIGVVVEGTMDPAGHFEGRRLMVSHDNEYRAPHDADADVEQLIKSTQGLEP